jgi:hypothetical protein
LPSDYEWNQLEKEIADSELGTYGTAATMTWLDRWETDENTRPLTNNGHGQVMKSVTKVKDANGTDVSTDPKGASHAATARGFDALLVGSMTKGLSVTFGSNAVFNCSTARDRWTTVTRTTQAIYSGVSRYYSTKAGLRSVRCKKNDN